MAASKSTMTREDERRIKASARSFQRVEEVKHEFKNHQCANLGVTRQELCDELRLEVRKDLCQHRGRGFKRSTGEEQPTETYEVKRENDS